ncbi:kinase-like domain-containing protein [Chytriomyces sp. MP71]|nr:kinase-like domain-containing protein [Chytriomyces sp. MP71]
MDKETRIWASLDHPHILSMYEVMELDDALCIVSELAQGGSLLSFLAQRGALPEPLARALFAQVAGAVHYMHAVARVVHRDIKCENILVLEDWKANAGFARSDQDTSEWTPTLKLADFGLSDWIGQEPHVPGASRSLASPSAESFGVGSLHYCAPEDLKGCKARATGEASDVWALGCVLFAMVTGGLPFNDGFLPRLQMTIVNGTYDAARLDAVGASAGLKELVKRVFEVDVEDRCTMEDMMGCEWMKGGLW